VLVAKYYHPEKPERNISRQFLTLKVNAFVLKNTYVITAFAATEFGRLDSMRKAFALEGRKPA
jgi:hypothetical protein